MRYLVGSALVAVCATMASADCPLPDPAASAQGWRVAPGDVYPPIAHNPGWPDIEVPLDLDAPVTPVILRFRGRTIEGRVYGFLTYFSGDPGTSSLTTLVRTAIVDFETGAVLGTPLTSVDCAAVPWRFEPGRIVVSDPNFGDQVIALLPE